MDRSVPVPDQVVVDTSFAVEALIGSQPLHAACQDFLVALAEAGTTLTYSRLLEVELAETAFQLALKERHPKDWTRFRHDGRARPRAERLMRATREAWADVTANVGSQCVEIHEVADAVPELMARYGLSSYDAIHAATALHCGLRHFVTLDVGFSSVPEADLVLYVNNGRLGRCRQIRASSR